MLPKQHKAAQIKRREYARTSPGGAGRLGIGLCKILQKKGFQAREFDLPSPYNRMSIRGLGKAVEISWGGDITDADSVRQDGVEAVIHMAWPAFWPR